MVSRSYVVDLASSVGLEHAYGDGDPDRPQAEPWQEYVARAQAELTTLLDGKCPEDLLHAFLEKHPSMVVGPSTPPHGGHHLAAWGGVFSKPGIPSMSQSWIPDFMWIASDSAAVRPVLIEIERPSKTWFTQKGIPSHHLNQALTQLDNWRDWFAQPGNAQQFKEVFVPREMHRRALEPHFVLLYGREREFLEAESRTGDASLRRQKSRMNSAERTVRTLDALRPTHGAANCLTLSVAHHTFEIKEVPTCWELDYALFAPLIARLGDIERALERSECGEDRKNYLKLRWAYWRQRGIQKNTTMFSMGAE